MGAKEKIQAELSELLTQGAEVFNKFSDKKKSPDITIEYQAWYSRSLKAMKLLAPDRFDEFRGYYEADPKRKSLGYGTYVIHDYIKGVAPGAYDLRDFDTRGQAARGMYNQVVILKSVLDRCETILNDIQGALLAELQDDEVDTAEALLKVNIRAAGALAGVILESHLQKIADGRGIKIAKKAPTVADLNDPLKAAGVYETATWRKISYLADIRNMCSHKKAADPSAEQAKELVDGVRWVVKNVA